jgi:hypothetical protein
MWFEDPAEMKDRVRMELVYHNETIERKITKDNRHQAERPKCKPGCTLCCTRSMFK